MIFCNLAPVLSILRYYKGDNMKYQKQKPVRLKGLALTRLYEQVAERDGWRCVECGCMDKLDRAPHHILPKGRGGGDTIDNLEILCIICHGRKHGLTKVLA